MKENSLTGRFLRSASWNSTAMIINRVGGLVLSILLARFLLPEKFGIYGLALSVGLIFVTFADLGVNTTFLRYLSDAIGKGKPSKAKAYFKYLLKIKFLLSLLASLSLVVAAYPLAYFVFSKEALFLPLVIIGIYIFFMSFEGFFGEIFLATNEVKYFAPREAIHQILRIGLSLLAIFTFASVFSVEGIFLAFVLSSLIILFYHLFFARRVAGFLFTPQKSEKINKKGIKRFLKYLSIGGISTMFFSYIDTLVLGIYLPAEYVGFYRAAFAIVFSIAGLLTFTSLLMPVFTKLSGKRLVGAFSKTIKYSALITIPASVGIIILSRHFIRLIYGYEYLLAALPLSILAALLFEATNTGILSAFLLAKGKVRFYTKAVIFATFLNILLNLIAIYSTYRISFEWSLLGVALATVLSRYVLFCILFIKIKKHFGASPKKSFFVKPICASLLMAIALFYLRKSFIPDMTLFSGILIILVGIFVYSITLAIIGGIGREETSLFKEFFFNVGK
jgi:stage V sporulation protein B